MGGSLSIREQARGVGTSGGSQITAAERAARDLAACAICSRQGHGFVFQYRFRSEFPHYTACSMPCLDLVQIFAARGMGRMADKTSMEKDAIKSARLPLYQCMMALGIAHVFDGCTASQIDAVIETIWDAVRQHMQMRTIKGDVPF
jgi:hypothetical protein